MLKIEEIPVERISEYWNIQFRYLVDDGMITTEDGKEYFQSSEYREDGKCSILDFWVFPEYGSDRLH